jgi:hypothetical protein
MEQNDTGLQVMPVEQRPQDIAPTDKLPWQDKLPLALALMAQSYVVFIWYLRSTHGIHPYVDFVIALAAGIALDWLTVSTVMGRREGRTSIWSWLTSFGAFVGSATIAYDTYATQWWPLDGQALLHVCYPLVVLLYSLHLAAPRQHQVPVAIVPLIRELEALPESPRGHQELSGALDAQGRGSSPVFSCPACGGALESIGELGAAKRWGHCRHCKGKTTVPLRHSTGQSTNGAAAE